MLRPGPPALSAARQLITALRWEAALQNRHHIYSGTALAAALSLGAFAALPDAMLRDSRALISIVVLVNLQLTTFILASALLLFDRAHGVIDALLTSPNRTSQYLWVRGLALCAPGTVQVVLIVAVAIGPSDGWFWLVVGAGMLTFVYALMGIAVSAEYADLRSFLLASPRWVIAFTVPLLGLFRFLPEWLFFWHPMTPALTLIQAPTRALSSSLLAYGLLGGLAWCAVAIRFADSRLQRLISPLDV